MEKRYVYIAGAGPGNPEYMTIRTLELLKSCDVVIYDNLVDESVLDNCKENCEKIYAGKSAGHHSMKQDEINDLIIEKAFEDKSVLRLKGGDPFVFGRGPEECMALKSAGIGYELIPGVTSAISVPMAAGIPVTNRQEARSFTVVTGHTAQGEITQELNFKALASTGGTLVFLMGLGNIDKIAAELVAAGMDESTPVAVISDGTGLNQYTVRADLSNVVSMVQNDKKVVSPAIIVVGSNAKLDLSCESRKKALDKVFVYSVGTKEFTKKVDSKIRQAGGKCASLPVISLEKTAQAPLLEKIKKLNEYDAIVFTGRNSIKIFMDALLQSEKDLRNLSSTKIATIGSATADYLKEEYHIIADYVPDEYNSIALANLLVDKYKNVNAKLFIPRAQKGSDELTDILSKAQISFDEIKIYDTVTNRNVKVEIEANEGYKNYILFGSAASVEAFFDNGGVITKDITVLCLGIFTANALKKYGIVDVVISKDATIDGMVNELITRNGEK